MLIGISGKKGHGKDTVAKFIMIEDLKRKLGIDRNISLVEWDQHYKEEYNYFRTRFKVKKNAGLLKRMLAEFTNVSVDKLEDRDFKESELPKKWQTDQMTTWRDAMKHLGMVIREHFHPRAWLWALLDAYNPGNYWIITDVRFPNEAEEILRKGGIVIKVWNPRLPDDDDAPSEREVDNVEADEVIINDGTLEDLQEQTQQIINDYEIRCT